MDNWEGGKKIHPMPKTLDPPSEEFGETTRLTGNRHSEKEEEEIEEPTKYTFTCGTSAVVIGAVLLIAVMVAVLYTDLLSTPRPVTKMIEIKWTCPSGKADCELTRKMTLMPITIDVPFERHWLDYTQQYRLQQELATVDSEIMAQIEQYYREM
jgi:hypothetical protein